MMAPVYPEGSSTRKRDHMTLHTEDSFFHGPRLNATHISAATPPVFFSFFLFPLTYYLISIPLLLFFLFNFRTLSFLIRSFHFVPFISFLSFPSFPLIPLPPFNNQHSLTLWLRPKEFEFALLPPASSPYIFICHQQILFPPSTDCATMTTVKSRKHTQLPTRSWLLSRIFFLILILATLTTSARATIFGVSTARLSYDIVSVKNNPTDIENLDLVMAGDDLPVALIAKTANIPKDGLFVSPDFLPSLLLTHI